MVGESPRVIDTARFLCLHPRYGTAEFPTTPYYEPCSRKDSWYVGARENLRRLQLLDADDRVLVLIAHDPAAMRSLRLYPLGTLDDWREKGWKEKLIWSFLDELPVEKGKPRPYLVDGMYMQGELVKRLTEQRLRRHRAS